MYGKGNVTDNSMNNHKKMAGAGMSGNFGVAPFPSSKKASRPAANRGDGYRREEKA